MRKAFTEQEAAEGYKAANKARRIESCFGRNLNSIFPEEDFDYNNRYGFIISRTTIRKNRKNDYQRTDTGKVGKFVKKDQKDELRHETDKDRQGGRS